jgi:phosphoribosylformylglycinamidine (FGAM) synthase-like amidotransferase family enzyme
MNKFQVVESKKYYCSWCNARISTTENKQQSGMCKHCHRVVHQEGSRYFYERDLDYAGQSQELNLSQYEYQ